MPTAKNRDACPGYSYASAIAHSLIRDFKKVPLSDKEQREEKLLTALDYGRTLLQVAEPLTKGTPHEGAFLELYNELQDLARPWSESSKEHFIEDTKTALVLEVCYEIQREVQELKRLRKKVAKHAAVVRHERKVAA